MAKIIRNEFAHSINGVEGRMFNAVAWDGQNNLQTLANQTWSARRTVNGLPGYPRGAHVTVELRFDDNCRNGHNDFAITGEVRGIGESRYSSACGCVHDEIAYAFPELAHLIKWHLTGTNGPMHYVANTTYHASNRDHSGRVKGEACAWSERVKFGDSPVTHAIRGKFAAFVKSRMGEGAQGEFRVTSIAHKDTGDSYKFAPKFTFVGFGEQWHECPFDSEQEAEQWTQGFNACRVEFVRTVTAVSEGKERDFKAARSCGVWPDATDEQLSLPKDELKALLEARLPALIAAFRADMDACGFLWDANI